MTLPLDFCKSPVSASATAGLLGTNAITVGTSISRASIAHAAARAQGFKPMNRPEIFLKAFLSFIENVSLPAFKAFRRLILLRRRIAFTILFIFWPKPSLVFSMTDIPLTMILKLLYHSLQHVKLNIS